MSKTFIDEFEVKEEVISLHDVTDYDTFSNKELLDELRNKIIQNLIDNNQNNEIGLSNYIKNEIDKTEDVILNEITTENMILNEIKTNEVVEIKETANQIIVEPKVVEENKIVTQQPIIQQVNLIETNAPKNEL